MLCASCPKREVCRSACPDLKKVLPKLSGRDIRLNDNIDYQNPKIRKFINGLHNGLWNKPHGNKRFSYLALREHLRIRDIAKKKKKYYVNMSYREKVLLYQNAYYYLHKEYFILKRQLRKSKDFEAAVSDRGNVLGRKKGSKDLRPRKKEGYFKRYAKE